MSIRIIFSSVSNSAAASVLASSVLPPPVGPRKMNDPIGRRGSLIPERARMMASATSRTASSWPTIRSCRIWSSRSTFSRSPSCRRLTGMPVHLDTIAAISSLVTTSRSTRPPLRAPQPLLLGLQPPLQIGDLAQAQFRGPVQVVVALGLLGLPSQLFQFLAERLHPAQRLALGLPLGPQRVSLGLQVGQFLAQVGQALL